MGTYSISPRPVPCSILSESCTGSPRKRRFHDAGKGDVDDFHSIQIIYGAEIVGGELRYEEDGTTDMCQWHNQDSLNSLSTVELVEKAIAYKNQDQI